jgi:hypothetical protein
MISLHESMKSTKGMSGLPIAIRAENASGEARIILIFRPKSD